MWSLYTGRWWVGCYIWYNEEGAGRGRSVRITVMLYSGPLLCGINVALKSYIQDNIHTCSFIS